MRRLTDDVVVDVVVEGGCSGPNRRTSLRLAWARTDPLAVRLIVTAIPDHPALPRGRWAVLRDFLRYGCDHATGDGDVRVRPDAARTTVELELWQHGRACHVSVPVDVVTGFLDATERIVPAGEERPEAELDALIARLLRASG